MAFAGTASNFFCRCCSVSETREDVALFWRTGDFLLCFGPHFHFFPIKHLAGQSYKHFSTTRMSKLQKFAIYCWEISRYIVFVFWHVSEKYITEKYKLVPKNSIGKFLGVRKFKGVFLKNTSISARYTCTGISARYTHLGEMYLSEIYMYLSEIHIWEKCISARYTCISARYTSGRHADCSCRLLILIADAG